MYGVAVLAEHRVLLGGRRLRTMVRTMGSSHRARPGVSPRWPDSARRSPLRAGIFDRRSGRVSITTNVALLLSRRCGWVKHRTLGRSRSSPTGGGDPAVQHVRPHALGHTARHDHRPGDGARTGGGPRSGGSDSAVGDGARTWRVSEHSPRPVSGTGRAVSPHRSPAPNPGSPCRGAGERASLPAPRNREWSCCPPAPRPRERAAKPPQLAANLWTVQDRFGLLVPYHP